MTPEEAVTLARNVVDARGTKDDSTAVRLAVALIDGAHVRDRLRGEIARLTADLNLNGPDSACCRARERVEEERDQLRDQVTKLTSTLGDVLDTLEQESAKRGDLTRKLLALLVGRYPA